MPAFDNALFLSTLGLIGAVIVVSALFSGLVERSGLPQVAIFLALGAMIGPLGLGLLDAGIQSPILRIVSTLSLVLVLFTDAVSLNLKEVRKHRRLAFLVIGPGTLMSAVLVALAGYWLLHLSVPMSLILAAALASTDPVLLRGLLRWPGLPANVKQALRLESGMNDAVLLPIVQVAMIVVAKGQGLTGMEWTQVGVKILVLSPVAGAIVGLGAIGLLEFFRRRIGVRRDYESIYSIGVAFAAFAAAESIHGSGFLAAFAAGLTISSIDTELCDCFLEYGETTAEMMLLFTFVLFGTSIIWTGLGVIGPATIAFTVLAFLLRPAAFLPALLAARIDLRDRLLIGWFGPKGLSSLLLVLLPVFAGITGSSQVLTICCLVVLCSVVAHGLSPHLILPRIRPPSTSALVSEPAPQNLTLPDRTLTLEQFNELRRAGTAVTLIDSRTGRAFDESGEIIPSAVRVHPDRAVQEAKASGMPREAVLAVFCA
ncbi:MAG: cation:proton antiporter [Bryobacteraceae bacterium]